MPLTLIIAGVLLLPAQDLDLQAVLTRAGAYVEQYQQDFSRLVCEERYTQELRQYYLGASPVKSSQIRRRRLVSEFALTRVEDRGNWLWQGFRDVIEVDDRPVQKERNRLEALFTSSPADLIARAHAIAEEGARYNLGQYRTINVPMLALRFFDAAFQPRQRYEKSGEERVTGVQTWRIAFDEIAVPTVIRTPEGEDVPSIGIAWVDPGTGRIVRTQLEPQHRALIADEAMVQSRATTQSRPLKSKIVVTYAPDARLGTWVPAVMEESHATAAVTVTGTATYSNCRRFETTARIKNDD